jgi:hypothetical protein
MEVSVIGNRTGYQLTEAARHLVEQIVVLDSGCRVDKEQLFEQLCELWKQDLVIGITNVKNRFTDNQQFIQDTILSSLPTHVQEKYKLEEEIYEKIKYNFSYTLPDNTVIESNSFTRKEFKNQVTINKRNISRRFESLLNEFIEFVYYKKHDKPTSVLYAPYTPLQSTRESLGRLAKDQALLIIEGYAGTASSSNPDGKKRKRGKKENADGTGESDESEVNNTL